MKTHTWMSPSGEMMVTSCNSPVMSVDKVVKRVTTVLRDGIRFSLLSDRGQAVKEEMRKEKSNKTSIPISILLITSSISIISLSSVMS